MVVCLGVLVGFGISIWVSKLVAQLLDGLEPGDPVTLGFSAAVLATVGVLAGWVPAQRAARVDPADIFRDK
jgi:ABC-type antimicrobial peptide transport system permease subunit